MAEMTGIGMLWYDPDPKANLTAKLARAAEYYRTKYGKPATLAIVNPKDHPGGDLQAAGCVVKADQVIRHKHFWLGVHS